MMIVTLTSESKSNPCLYKVETMHGRSSGLAIVRLRAEVRLGNVVHGIGPLWMRWLSHLLEIPRSLGFLLVSLSFSRRHKGIEHSLLNLDLTRAQGLLLSAIRSFELTAQFSLSVPISLSFSRRRASSYFRTHCSGSHSQFRSPLRLSVLFSRRLSLVVSLSPFSPVTYRLSL
ncbi:hypothetical protein RIF29_22660 [Crotalaria pallida]|uniref:Uncharacterized protein n=1 Tax=Crotalaria pallida TaxID=3830 RepID=A0AAN9F599_CROPI